MTNKELTNEELLAAAARVDEETKGDPTLDEMMTGLHLAQSLAQDASLSPERKELMMGAANHLGQKYTVALAYEMVKMLIPFRLETDSHPTETLQRLLAALTDGAS